MSASYKIPQNVDLEDKILGPFTLKQFLMVLTSGFVVFITFKMFWAPLPAVFFVLTFLNAVATAAFVFVRPNDQPFTRFAASFFSFSTKPQRRTWKRIPTLGGVSLHEAHSEPPKVVAEPSAEEVRSNLQRLAHIVDTRGWSDVDADGDGVGDRIVSDQQAKPKLNISIAASEEPEDILAAEDDDPKHTSRASHDLDKVL